MTTYRLPDLLGGREMKAYHHKGDPQSASFYVEGEVVWVPLSLLTEVQVLPEEPDIAAVVLDRHLRAWQHLAFGGRGDWCCTVDDLGADWEELNREYGPLVPLIHDPFAGSMELPWSHTDREAAEIAVIGSSRRWAACRVQGDTVDLTAEAAMDMARALVSAARRQASFANPEAGS